MGLSEALRGMVDPRAHELSEAEYEAARAYVSAVKDSLDGDTKAGLLKLLRAEEYRRTFGPDKRP